MSLLFNSIMYQLLPFQSAPALKTVSITEDGYQMSYSFSMRHVPIPPSSSHITS